MIICQLQPILASLIQVSFFSYNISRASILQLGFYLGYCLSSLDQKRYLTKVNYFSKDVLFIHRLIYRFAAKQSWRLQVILELFSTQCETWRPGSHIRGQCIPSTTLSIICYLKTVGRLCGLEFWIFDRFFKVSKFHFVIISIEAIYAPF